MSVANLEKSVQQRYGDGARQREADLCCPIDYDPKYLAVIPDEVLERDYGCGDPSRHLRPGETVLDLGSGTGKICFIAAQVVGAEGRVIGVDMTPEMVERARAAARQAGLEQVEFRQGRLEQLPVADGSIDAVTSNCVINLVPDKGRVFAEVARVLKPGGRLVISDIVLDAPLPAAVADDLLAYVGCVAGALPRADYFAAVAAAGLTDVEVLTDSEALELLGGEIPAGVVELLERTGTDAAELRGKVRSVSYRACKPAAG